MRVETKFEAELDVVSSEPVSPVALRKMAWLNACMVVSMLASSVPPQLSKSLSVEK